ncbi:Zinc finger BED domain-containing protein RICESLEEPER 2 [Pseudolycoriella hygida]|uniref:Zinc finger BED domain-containing protein RICESLEEPER 2 n=1 Tax=Pseudolycoriella hygida TaxID=35572 RepID=A0A9Q0MYK2_9DIPT|nr:Zinc finger BED domain-containing protein RICESLEEPER 2 [Pseudolycoriella hygida]
MSFTVDGWTSNNMLPFMAIRGHTRINIDWIYETVLLDFTYIEGDHCASSLCSFFIKCLQFFDIPLTKVLAVTMDNTGSNDTFMTALRDYRIEVGVDYTPNEHRVRCMAHILNLSVQDIMKNLKIVPERGDNEEDCIDIVDEDTDVLNVEDEVDDDEATDA